jgi:hypothetical protein
VSCQGVSWAYLPCGLFWGARVLMENRNGHRMNEETGICVTFEEFADGEADGEGGREEVLG